QARRDHQGGLARPRTHPREAVRTDRTAPIRRAAFRRRARHRRGGHRPPHRPGLDGQAGTRGAPTATNAPDRLLAHPGDRAPPRSSHRACKATRAPKVRVLPHTLPVGSLPTQETEPRTVPIGVDERALAPVMLDLFERDQNLLVLGDGESGKTNLLRLISEGL